MTTDHPMTVEYARKRAAQIVAPHVDNLTIANLENLIYDIAYALLIADRDAHGRGVDTITMGGSRVIHSEN